MYAVDRTVLGRTSVIARVVLVCLNGKTVWTSLLVFVNVEILVEVFVHVSSVFDTVKKLVGVSVNMGWTSSARERPALALDECEGSASTVECSV